jgi:hypothetical protein
LTRLEEEERVVTDEHVKEDEDWEMFQIWKKMEAENDLESLKSASSEPLMELLQQEMMENTVLPDEPWYRMENGVDWLPESEVRAGDLREMEGLWGDGVFRRTTWSAVPEGTRVIGSRLVRRIKNQTCKSRHVLHDFARSGSGPKLSEGDVFAATPAISTWRL